MTDWTAKLPTLDTDALGVIDCAKLAIPWDGKLTVDFGDGQTDVAPVDGYRSPALKRSALDLRDANATALKHMAELPAPGEAYHFVIGDRWGLWDLVPATLARIAPRIIPHLYVSTLSYGAATAAEMLSLLDTRKIERISLLVSVMFAAKNRHLYDELIPHLLSRAQSAGAMRTHCKILAFDLGPGECFTVESSSNLRGCHCAEQVTVINDRGLFEFHAAWIERAIGKVRTNG